jgi:hypothetical protein
MVREWARIRHHPTKNFRRSRHHIHTWPRYTPNGLPRGFRASSVSGSQTNGLLHEDGYAASTPKQRMAAVSEHSDREAEPENTRAPPVMQRFAGSASHLTIASGSRRHAPGVGVSSTDLSSQSETLGLVRPTESARRLGLASAAISAAIVRGCISRSSAWKHSADRLGRAGGILLRDFVAQTKRTWIIAVLIAVIATLVGVGVGGQRGGDESGGDARANGEKVIVASYSSASDRRGLIRRPRARERGGRVTRAADNGFRDRRRGGAALAQGHHLGLPRSSGARRSRCRQQTVRRSAWARTVPSISVPRDTNSCAADSVEPRARRRRITQGFAQTLVNTSASGWYHVRLLMLPAPSPVARVIVRVLPGGASSNAACDAQMGTLSTWRVSWRGDQ